MQSLLLLVTCSLFLVSCQSNQNQIPVLGHLDSAAIALDTAMQLGFESSYEYHKTLVVNNKLVYDIVGYGGPASKGEYAVLRREEGNKTDTVSKGVRNGVIVGAYLADSNHDNLMEVVIEVKNPATDTIRSIIRFETNRE